MKYQIMVAVGCCAMMCSCTTTGDPRQGGLWGWSETKSIQRVDDLRAQADDAQAEYDAAKRRQSAKASQLNRAKAESRAAKRVNGAVDSKVNTLQRDVKLLEIR